MTFRKVLDGMRSDVARNLLRETHRTVGEIGGYLGDGDRHSFPLVPPMNWRQCR